MTFKDWSAVVGTWVSIAAAIVGGYFALNTYHADVSQRANARALQTFALFRDFQSGDMLRIRRDILTRRQASDQDIYAYIDFFDTVDACVERDICDRELAEQLFAPYARASIEGLAPWIADARVNEAFGDQPQPAGSGLERLAGAGATELIANAMAAGTLDESVEPEAAR